MSGSQGYQITRTGIFCENGKPLSIRINDTFVCNQIGAVIDACVSGVGFGLFYDYQVMPQVECGELEIVLRGFEPAPVPVNIVFLHSRLMSMRIRALLDWLARDLKQTLE